MATVMRGRSERFVRWLARYATAEQLLQNAQVSAYQYFSHSLAKNDVVFLNYGYEEDPPMALPLQVLDEPNRLPIQLYDRVATQVDIAGKQVLEISCGHGGGASYLTRAYKPSSYTGLDLNATGINLCRQKHSVPDLFFVQGDAQSLPFPDESFDVVLNIEASLYYREMDTFLAEVARVLRSGGHFVYADIRESEVVAAWESALARSQLRMVSQQKIGTEVARALENNPLLRQLPRILPDLKIIRKAAVKMVNRAGSLVRHRLLRGEASYRMYCFAKD